MADLPAHRTAIGREMLNQFDSLRHTVDLPLEEGGGTFLWEMIDPARLLSESIVRCPKIAEAYKQACSQAPPSVARPWNLIVAFDEFSPGNKLQVVELSCKGVAEDCSTDTQLRNRVSELHAFSTAISAAQLRYNDLPFRALVVLSTFAQDFPHRQQRPACTCFCNTSRSTTGEKSWC